MIRLTALDGQEIAIDAALIVRIRRTLADESAAGNRGAQTRIDWARLDGQGVSLVREALDQVIALVKPALPSLTVATAPDGTKIWFDALRVIGPVALPPRDMVGGARSTIELGGHTQRLFETAEQVRVIIRDAGGQPL
ncbi:MAG: hypothetical protein AB7F22_14410 [Reyranella sp.]|uniref:hypothetical protein n=1 Tax=Reyranella sp. TaxID=1929291 RepID=UPI003D0E68D3